jgi:Mce-associated membrane protein
MTNSLLTESGAPRTNPAADTTTDAAAGTTPDVSADASAGASLPADQPEVGAADRRAQPRRLKRMMAYVVLPTVVLAMAGGAGYAKYLQARHHALDTARSESVAAARDITIAMLSYTPDGAATNLGAARDKMTGPLLDSYTSLIDDVVIPGAKQKQISAAATVAAAAPLTVTETHAVILIFVDQSITQGKEAPSGTASSVRVTLDKVDSQWRASGFDPV